MADGQELDENKTVFASNLNQPIYSDALAPDCGNSIANALELSQSCT